MMKKQAKKYLIWRVDVWSMMYGEGGRKYYLTDWPEDEATLAAQERKIERLGGKWAKGIKGYTQEATTIEKWAEAELVEVKNAPQI